MSFLGVIHASSGGNSGSEKGRRRGAGRDRGIDRSAPERARETLAEASSGTFWEDAGSSPNRPAPGMIGGAFAAPNEEGA